MNLQIMEQGSRNLVLLLNGTGDTLVLDPATYGCSSFTIMKMQYNCAVDDGAPPVSNDIKWGAAGAATTDCFSLNGHYGNHCFQKVGGLHRPDLANSQLVVTLAAASSLVLTMKKVY